MVSPTSQSRASTSAMTLIKKAAHDLSQRIFDSCDAPIGDGFLHGRWVSENRGSKTAVKRPTPWPARTAIESGPLKSFRSGSIMLA